MKNELKWMNGNLVDYSSDHDVESCRLEAGIDFKMPAEINALRVSHIPAGIRVVPLLNAQIDQRGCNVNESILKVELQSA